MSDFIVVKGKKFETLLAISEQEQQTGLMWRKAPLPVMTFVYAEPRVNKFWMHNVEEPLDIVFCKSNKIISIFGGRPFSTALIGDNQPSDLVIEFPGGTCESEKISVGDDIATQYSDATLMKLFFLKNGFAYSALRQY